MVEIWGEQCCEQGMKMLLAKNGVYLLKFSTDLRDRSGVGWMHEIPSQRCKECRNRMGGC